MIEEFRKYISDNSLFSPDDKIILAVSGGIDSMVMTHLFLRCGFEFAIAHCNFRLRGQESDKDEEFVSTYAASHNISFFSKQFDTAQYASEKGLSIQMAARDLRYNWFEGLRAEKGYGLIALAHNLNDNIETFLINMARGSGIAGFAGIPVKNARLIRPILFAARSEIRDYCDKYEIVYREDSSNSDTKYIRNRIRHNVVPEFRQINPSFEKTIEETIARIGEINEIYSDHIRRVKDSLLKEMSGVFAVDIKDILSLTPLHTMVFELFRGFGLSRSMIPEFIKLISASSGSHLLTSTHRFIKNRGEIIISESIEEAERHSVYHNAEDLLKDKNLGQLSIVPCDENFTIPQEVSSSCLSLDKLKFPVIVRNWKAGDFFYPLGMNRKKKLSDFFIDNKFSIPEKEKALVLESDGKIACIIGVRTDNRFRITATTGSCLIIESDKS